MNSKQESKRSHSAANGTTFWHRLRDRWLGGLNFPGFGRSNNGENDSQVKVWDRHRGCYRYVDLSDRTDPLWSAAYSLANFQHECDRRRPAA